MICYGRKLVALCPSAVRVESNENLCSAHFLPFIQFKIPVQWVGLPALTLLILTSQVYTEAFLSGDSRSYQTDTWDEPPQSPSVILSLSFLRHTPVFYCNPWLCHPQYVTVLSFKWNRKLTESQLLCHLKCWPDGEFHFTVIWIVNNSPLIPSDSSICVFKNTTYKVSLMSNPSDKL